jgi:UDP-N-acetylmuramyl pentapeptide phosphotransferase/UDP-N-acetylglucosamine-1-phosphate transferase
MGSLLIFVLFFFLLMIAIPIINIIGVLLRVKKKARQQQGQYENFNNTEKKSPINKRFDKSKAEDVEFEEV